MIVTDGSAAHKGLEIDRALSYSFRQVCLSPPFHLCLKFIDDNGDNDDTAHDYLLRKGRNTDHIESV